jgi:hypothetical protein
MRWSQLNGVEYCAIGIVLLGTSLMARHVKALDVYPFFVEWRWGESIINFDIHPVIMVGFWGGSIMVVIGVGRILFLERT